MKRTHGIACAYQFFGAPIGYDREAGEAEAAEVYRAGGEDRDLEEVLARHLARTPSAALAIVAEADRRFFDRFPERGYHVRLTSRAEIAQLARDGCHLGPPRPGTRWFTAIRRTTSGVLLRAWCELPDGAVDGASEAACLDTYWNAVDPQGRASSIPGISATRKDRS